MKRAWYVGRDNVLWSVDSKEGDIFVCLVSVTSYLSRIVEDGIIFYPIVRICP